METENNDNELMTSYNGKSLPVLEAARLRARDFPTCSCDTCVAARALVTESANEDVVKP